MWPGDLDRAYETFLDETLIDPLDKEIDEKFEVWLQLQENLAAEEEIERRQLDDYYDDRYYE